MTLLYSALVRRGDARMPASSAAVEEVVGRIRTIQRRLNASTIQSSTCLAATVATLAAAVVVGTALRAGTTVFGVAFWTALVAAALAAIHAVLRIRQQWLSIEQTAYLTDRRASLDDRLATVLAAQRDGGASRLYPVLLAQVRDTAPRWDADILAPRRAPRSLYSLLAAVAILIATSFYARPPTPPHASTAAYPGAQTADAEQQVQAAARQGDGAAALMGAAGGNDGNADHATMRVNSGAGRDGGAGSESGNRRDPGSAAGAGGSADETGTEPEVDPRGEIAGLSARVQDSLRDALGAGDIDRDRIMDTAPKRAAGQGSESSSSAQDAPPLPDGQRNDPAAQQPSEADPARQELAKGGSTAAGGAGAIGSAGELFGGQPAAHPVGSGSHSLSVKLGAHTALSPSQHEPQRQSPPLTEMASASAPANRQAQQLVDEHLPIAALHKPDIAAEHEAVVRRIFTRDE